MIGLSNTYCTFLNKCSILSDSFLLNLEIGWCIHCQDYKIRVWFLQLIHWSCLNLINKLYKMIPFLEKCHKDPHKPIYTSSKYFYFVSSEICILNVTKNLCTQPFLSETLCITMSYRVNRDVWSHRANYQGSHHSPEHQGETINEKIKFEE